jgi:quinol monooxygenase YgiN
VSRRLSHELRRLEPCRINSSFYERISLKESPLSERGTYRRTSRLAVPRTPPYDEPVTNSYGMHGHFKAQPGKGDELAALLLEAADVLGDMAECRLYLISRSLDDADTVWVTEAWTSRAAHEASLTDERVRVLIQRAAPVIAGASEAMEMRPQGGKGVSLSP